MTELRPLLHFWIGIFILIAAQSCSTPQATSTGRHGFLDSPDSHDSRDFRDSAAAPHSSRQARLFSQLTRPVPGMRDSFDEKGEFRWPVRYVQVTSPFGRRGKEFHEGVDLRAPQGTPVYASKSGVVLYADSKIHGYGNLVVIRHSSQISTIYAHNSKLLVHRGDRVRQGQVVAVSGNTGYSHGPHVHFEIRQGMSAVNPARLLSHTSQQPTHRPVPRSRRLAASAQLAREIPRRN